jgi:methyl-accepting chemotaxis protein
MQWFYNLKIKNKLLSSYIIVAIIASIIGYVGYSGIYDSGIAQNELATYKSPALMLINKMESALNFSVVAERGVINNRMFSDPVVRDAQFKTAETGITEFNNARKELEPLLKTNEEKTLFNSTVDNYNKWKTKHELLIALGKEKEKLMQNDSKENDALIVENDAKILAFSIENSDQYLATRNAIRKLNDIILKSVQELNQNSDKERTSDTLLLIIFTISGFATAILLGLFITNLINKPIKSVVEMAQELSKGHVKARAEVMNNDELGVMANTCNYIAVRLNDYSDTMHKIAEGDLSVSVQATDKDDILAPALNSIVNSLNNLKNETIHAAQIYQSGNTDHRIDSDKFNGGYREITEGFNKSINVIVYVIRTGYTAMQKLGEGDLTARMEGDFQGSFKRYQDNINRLGESLNHLVIEIKEAVVATASASNEITSSSEQMAAGSQEQSSQTAEVASAIEEMTKTILETSKNSAATSEAAKNSGMIAQEGGKVVSETIQGMVRIAEVVNKSADTVQTLGKSSNQIGEIIQVINDIADQTNLLALNAAIEAARAGEQGRGFAVVADEVRKLAERTTKATKEIASMIKQIQKDTDGAVASMKEGTFEVEKGKQLADLAGQSLEEIIKSAEEVVDMSTQVAAASEEQSSAAEQISKNVEAISNVTQESAAGIHQIARASEDLNRLTVNLQNIISKFKIEESQLLNQRNLELDSKNHHSVRANGIIVES